MHANAAKVPVRSRSDGSAARAQTQRALGPVEVREVETAAICGGARALRNMQRWLDHELRREESQERLAWAGRWEMGG